MQFMMLMIPNVYRGNKKLDPGFVPDPKKVAEMARFNGELGKAVKILSLNGLHPLNTGARVSFGKGKPTVTDGPFIESKEVLGAGWQKARRPASRIPPGSRYTNYVRILRHNIHGTYRISNRGISSGVDDLVKRSAPTPISGDCSKRRKPFWIINWRIM